MRVVIDLDRDSSYSGKSEYRSSSKSSLEPALLEQFMQVQRKLMGWLESQGSRDEKFLSSLRSSQDELLSAMKTMSGSGANEDKLLSAIQGLKKNASISMPREFLDRFSSIEQAIAEGMKKSRNRTFGSNY